MTPVNVTYNVDLDDGVQLTIVLRRDRFGPAVKTTMFPTDEHARWHVQLPGSIVQIYAPSVTVGGINWANVARAIGAEFDFPRQEPPPPKPKPDPYIQKAIE